MALALIVGGAWATLTWVGDHGSQLVNAGAWWWGWLAVPVAAALLAALARRRGTGPAPWLLAVLLLAPMAVAFIAHDRLRGPPTGLLAGRLDAAARPRRSSVPSAGLARRPPR